MSISDNYAPVKTLGNGATVNFTGSWPVFNEDYIRVYLENVTTGVQTLQVLGTDFTLVFDSSGFTVTFGTAPSSSYYVVIGRSVPLDQTTPYKTSQGFQGKEQEESYDKLTAMVQDLQDEVDRAPKLPLGSTVDLTLPAPDAGKALLWNAAEDGLENSDDDFNDIVSDATAQATAAAASAGSASSSAAAASVSATASAGSATSSAASAASAAATLAAALLKSGGTMSGDLNTTADFALANDGKVKWGAGSSYLSGNATAGTLYAVTSGGIRWLIDTSGFNYIQMAAPQTPDATHAGLRLGQPAAGACVSSGGNVTTSQQHWSFVNGNNEVGGIFTNASATTYATSSDYRLKENVAPIDDPIAMVRRLNPVSYNFIAQPQYRYTGFLAHELKEVIYEAVVGRKDEMQDIGNVFNAADEIVYENVLQPEQLAEGLNWQKTGERIKPQGVDMAKVVPILTAALQIALEKIDALETRLDALGG